MTDNAPEVSIGEVARGVTRIEVSLIGITSRLDNLHSQFLALDVWNAEKAGIKADIKANSEKFDSWRTSVIRWLAIGATIGGAIIAALITVLVHVGK